MNLQYDAIAEEKLRKKASKPKRDTKPSARTVIRQAARGAASLPLGAAASVRQGPADVFDHAWDGKRALLTSIHSDVSMPDTQITPVSPKRKRDSDEDSWEPSP